MGTRGKRVVNRSGVPFRHARRRHQIDALGAARILVTSRALGWPGLLVERGVNDGWDVGDLTVDAHYFALNLERVPLPILVRDGGEERTETLRPGAGWFCPAGERFSHRVDVRCHFALCTITPEAFARWLAVPAGEAPPRLLRRYDVRATALAAILRALVAEAASAGAGGLPFIETLGRAMSLQFAQHFGTDDLGTSARGGLSARARRTVLRLVQERLDDPPHIAELAAACGVSTGHFQRAFRESFGRSPWRQVLAWRLEAARRALLSAASVSEVALRFGFADQSHFTRHFRRYFGVTPGTVLRTALPPDPDILPETRGPVRR